MKQILHKDYEANVEVPGKKILIKFYNKVFQHKLCRESRLF